MKTIIFDLDGTLCDITHRLHHIKGEKKDWSAFFKACVDDEPKHSVIKLFKLLDMGAWMDGDHQMIIVSGRSDLVRPQTEIWLDKHTLLHDRLIMRKNGDHTPDHELKRSWLYDGTLPPKEDILFCVDDRQRVVDMWRSEGLTCLQVDAWSEA